MHLTRDEADIAMGPLNVCSPPSHQALRLRWLRFQWLNAIRAFASAHVRKDHPEEIIRLFRLMHRREEQFLNALDWGFMDPDVRRAFTE